MEETSIQEEIYYETDENGMKCKVIVKTILKTIIKESNNELNCYQRASKKYKEQNKEKVRKQIVEWQKNKYQTDPEYREKIKQRRKDYYYKQKMLKQSEQFQQSQ